MTLKGKVIVTIGKGFCMDGGMTRQTIYHNDNDWRLGK